MPCVAIDMDVEILMLREVSHRGELSYDIPYMQSLKRNDTSGLTDKTETGSQAQRMNLWLLERKGGGRDSQGVWDGHEHAAVFNTENQQGPAGQHREVCSTLCDNLMVTRGKDGGRDSQGVWEGHRYTAVFNMENQQGPAGQPREVCSMSRGSRDGRAVWWRVGTCVCISESLCCPAKTVINRL